MFGFENLVLSRLTSETSVDGPITSSITNNNNSNDSFLSINSDHDQTISFINYPISNINTTPGLLNRLDSMAECPAYLLPRLSYSNLSQSFTEKHLLDSKANSSRTRIKSNNSAQSVSKLNYNYYTDDFILLSEFSEIEGPKPLFTIPTDGGTGFNKNDYSLHLMCVDFHSHLQFLQSQETLNSNKTFSLTKDTSIINYWDTNSTLVTACVHHFTLYDLDARGFVRPFCLAYISYDQKSIGFFEQIRKKFTDVTNLFKKSNLNVFRNELEQRCADLKFTREFFLEWSAFFDQKKFNSETNEEDSKFQSVINKLVNDMKLDEKSVARLNYSCSSDMAKQHQLATIENMINEMENMLSVIMDELKNKYWLRKSDDCRTKSSKNKFEFNR